MVHQEQMSLADFPRRVIDIDVRGDPLPISTTSFGRPSAPVDVVFSHANGFNAGTYRKTFEGIGPMLHILAVDQRGHGATPQRRSTEGRRDILDLRDDLLALLDVLDEARPVILSGHSIGGCVSLLAAAERPERVRGLILFDPVVLSRDRFAEFRAEEFDSPIARTARVRRSTFASRAEAYRAYRERTVFRGLSDHVLMDYVTSGFRDREDGQVELSCAPEWEASNFTAPHHDVWLDLERITAPARIFRAETDSTCALKDPAELPGHAAPLEIVTIPNTTHFFPLERPELVREALLTGIA